MGDVGEYWREHKTHLAKENREYQEYFERFGKKKLLKSFGEEGLKVQVMDDSTEKWEVSYNSKIVYYWPSTGTIYNNWMDKSISTLNDAAKRIKELLK